MPMEPAIAMTVVVLGNFRFCDHLFSSFEGDFCGLLLMASVSPNYIKTELISSIGTFSSLAIAELLLNSSASNS